MGLPQHSQLGELVRETSVQEQKAAYDNHLSVCSAQLLSTGTSQQDRPTL